METNILPAYDMSDNPTGCCPRFMPDGWDDQDLHFKNKLFVRAKTRSLFHIPINMGSVFERTYDAIQAAEAQKDDDIIIMSRDLSPWTSEHLFSVDKTVPGQETVLLNGDFHTKVFEGPFKDAPNWCKEVEDDLSVRGKEVQDIYFFYTTCPKCAKTYGKNYVVALAQMAPESE